MFFFFKQKTAYEMRISDWSSDVCSSDLQIALEAGDDAEGIAVDRRTAGANVHKTLREVVVRQTVTILIRHPRQQRSRDQRVGQHRAVHVECGRREAARCRPGAGIIIERERLDLAAPLRLRERAFEDGLALFGTSDLAAAGEQVTLRPPAHHPTAPP